MGSMYKQLGEDGRMYVVSSVAISYDGGGGNYETTYMCLQCDEKGEDSPRNVPHKADCQPKK